MEVIISSPVQESSVMKVDKGDGMVKLTKSRKRKMAKKNVAELKDRLNANLESFDKQEDTDTGLAKTASSVGITGDEKSSIALSSLQDNTYSGIGTTANMNAEVKVENKIETSVGEKDSGTKATDNSASKKRKKTRKKKNPKSGTTATVDQNNRVLTSSATGDENNLISKIEPSIGQMGSSMTTNLNAEVKVENKMETTVGSTGSGTNETDNTVSKKRKMKRKKKIPESGTTATVDQNNRVLTSSATGDEKSLVSKIEPSSGEMGSSMTTNLNAEVKIENKMETTVGETGSGTNETDNTVSKKRKRQKKKKMSLESGDVLSTNDYTQDKTTTPCDEKSSISGMEIDKGTDAVKLSKSQSLDKREDTENSKSKPEIGFHTISLLSLQDNQFSGIDTTATDNTASKERKRKTKKKKNPVLGDVLSTCDNTQDKTPSPGDEKSSISGMEIDKGTDVVKLSKSQSLDKREGTENTKTKPEIGFHTISLSSLQDNQFSGIDTTATDNSASKERKRKTKKKKNPVLGDVLSTCDNTQDKTPSPGDEKSSISGMEIDKGTDAVKLSISQSLDKREDTENTKTKPEIGFHTISLSSLQDNQFNGIDTTATDNTALKERKRKTKMKKKPVSGDVLSTCDNTQDKAASLGDEKSSISGMEIDNGNDAVKLSNSQSLDKREDTENTKSKPEIGIYTISLSSLQDNKFSGIDTTATDNTVSKEGKKTKKNPVSGDVLSTCESSKDKTSTPGDEESLISGMKIDKGNNCPVKLSKAQKRKLKQLTNNHELIKTKLMKSQKKKLASDGNLSTVKEEKRKPKSKNTRLPTLGEILNPRYLELLEGGTNIKKTEERKRQKLNKTDESAQDAYESLEALSTELKTEDHLKTANVEKAPSTIVDADGTILKDTEVATISEPADLEIAKAKENMSLPIKMVKQYAKVQEKKLVIFDVNGLLADFVSPPPKDMIADFRIPRQAIFKRPFLDDFLRFCFDRFHVGIWSSRTMQNLDPVVNFLLGDLKKKLLFLWDASKCTNSGMRTLEDRHKCLVLKDLRKIWEKDGPNKSWVKGSFNDTNTLLLDDSPYKALVNPKHSGIFPVSYSYKNIDDNFLGPKGELQNYLEGLAGSDNVKTYVEQHPFGESAIDERHPEWTYYARVLKGQSR